MNERIRELADKAIEDMPGAWNIPDEFCKKFAELIVKECAHVGFNAAYPDKGVVVLTAIKQHFGVKE
jgi:hypothetical protein